MAAKRKRGLKDQTGRRFGRLTALSLIEPRDGGGHVWLFRCDCGNEKRANIRDARSGHTQSCGCLAAEIIAARNVTHGLSNAHPRAYRTWKDMRARCNCPTRDDYHLYGGRGISICARWADFAAFLADMGDRPKNLTLDRIDTNGNYEPGNCRWASSQTQANNKRNNHWVMISGESRTLQEWCDSFGIEPSKVRYRLAQGWPVGKAFQPEDFRGRSRSAD